MDSKSSPNSEDRERHKDGVTVTERVRPISRRWLVAGGIFLAFFLFITGLVISGVTQSIDASAALYVNHMNIGTILNELMVLASQYGREYFWIPVVALMLVLGKKDTKMLAVELAILFVLGIIGGEAMKYAMFRARPFETLPEIITRIARDTDSSYPSGHALIVSIGAIFALTRFRKKSIALLLTVEAAIVCYSRVYVGVHYPLDVVSGIALGGFIVCIGIYALGRVPFLRKIVLTIANLTLKLLHAGWVSL